VWRIALLGAVALFIVTRALTLMAFPIFNDEAIYLQYSQAIHDSWQKNRFISMNGGYHDWKPPLQYWLAAPFIRGGSDPLLQGRLVAVLFSLVGLAGTYLFTKELLGGREGVIAVFLYALCPAVLLYNNQFIAEAFLFSTAALFYWCVLRLLRAANRPAAGFAIAAVLLGTALLLFKQSGLLLLLLAVRPAVCAASFCQKLYRGRRYRWVRLPRRLACHPGRVRGDAAEVRQQVGPVCR
jgi:4-amino-4-deoxy-L-arabinose transferase-like glycosyltransferase